MIINDSFVAHRDFRKLRRLWCINGGLRRRYRLCVRGYPELSLQNDVEVVVTLDVINEGRHYLDMIVSFKCKDTEKLACGRRVRRFVNIERVALRKIRQLQVASHLDDLRVPPGNMLELLSGDREGHYSIRINRQFRVCFRWTKAGAEDVEIVDYH